MPQHRGHMGQTQNETDSSTAYPGWQDDETRETATIDEYLAANYSREEYHYTTYGEKDVSENISPLYYGARYELCADIQQLPGFQPKSR